MTPTMWIVILLFLMFAVAVYKLFVSNNPKDGSVGTNIPQPAVEDRVSGKYRIQVSGPQGNVQFWSVGEPTAPKEIPYGWAMVETDEAEREVFLWMIYVREDLRRKGYGRDIIRVLQEKFFQIRTHYSRGIVSKPGVKLCMSMGFEMKPSIHKRQPDELVWKRG
jgi:GNAT superfamily N-acetyltransferase